MAPKWPKYFTRWSIVWLALAGFFSFKLGCHSPSPSKIEPTSTVSLPIINGASDLSHPAIGALVVQRRSSFCTGTLITRQLVVTAAHCVDAIARYGLSNVQFRTDFADPNAKFRPEYHELQSVSKHPSYSSGPNYDIAVMVLKQKVTDPNVKPIPANDSAMDQKWIGTTVKVVGYGLIQTRPSFRSADQKYAADIPLFRIAQFSFTHFDEKAATDARKSACHGDSGGPALYMVNGKLRVLGVTSIAYRATNAGGGRTYCDGGAVSTRTDVHMNFLRPFLTKYSDGPATCASDADCDACSACDTAKKLCGPKPIASQPTQCRPCRTDADCGDGVCHRFKAGFRCLQACTKDSCCPNGSLCNARAGTAQSKAVCVPSDDLCPPATCSQDSECGPGEACDAAKGECKPSLPPRSPELCLPCKSHADCGTGLCYGPKNNGRCTQPCGAGDFCPDDFVCASLYPGLPKQCQPSDGTCRLPCQLDGHCPTDFECKEKFCVRKGGGIHGDTCDPMPCKDGLKCVLTASGRACMQPCGIEPGYGGTLCPSDGQCKGGARCYRNSNLRVCIAECQTTNDCKAKGGGSCSQLRNCLCRKQEDCEKGYSCNFFIRDQNGLVGACVPDSGNKTCASDFECREFSEGEFCVEKGAGVRSVGESCDSLNRCKEGLSCLRTSSGLVCFEDCSSTRQCKLGGRCVQVSGSISLCLCQQSGDCPQGRVCNQAFQGYGYCAPGGKSQSSCLDDKECPPYHGCKEGKCVATGTPPKPEPSPEPQPRPEPTTPDAGPGPEPQAKPEPTTPDAVTKDVAPIAKTDTTPPKPPGTCGCQSSREGGPIPAWIALLGLMWLLPLRRKQPFSRS